MTPAARRRALLTATGVAAAGLGAWWGWRQLAPAPTPVALAGDPLPDDFWQWALARPDGQPLDWREDAGQPLLLNFWATWCAPCIKEMPELDRFHRAFAPRGWRTIGLAIDNAKPVTDFLDKVAVGFDIAIAGYGGTEWARKLGNDAGSLPFTVLIDRHGRIRHRKLGPTHFDELAAWATALSVT